jgi:hypothetical protein
MPLKYSLLNTILIILLHFNTHAQVELSKTAVVRGKIMDEKGLAIHYATIRVKGTNIIVSTESNGTFELKNVPYGNHEILASSVEIKAKSQKLHVHKPQHDIVLAVSKAVLDLNEVQIVRKTEKREIETQGFAANVIETKEVALRNLQTNDLLNRTVGVRVRQNGGLGSAVDYNLNGMSGGSVRIFIDGIPISTFGSSFSLNSIPPANIERIEIYKGVIPAHLSDDALGGAINVILKKGLNNSLAASVSYGSFNTLQSSLTGMYRNDKTGLTVKSSGFYTTITKYGENSSGISCPMAVMTMCGHDALMTLTAR